MLAQNWMQRNKINYFQNLKEYTNQGKHEKDVEGN